MSTKKIFSVITTLAVVVMLVGPVAPVGAATAEELAQSIADAQALLNSLTQQLTAMQAGTTDTTDTTGTTASVSACSGITFSRNLTVGSKGDDVKCLQALLNQSADTQVASTGVGSTGNETTYFGALTKAAVAKYQAKNGISPVAGFFGPITRTNISSMLTGTTDTTGTTLPAGCTSTSGYSPTTGQSCATGVAVTPTLPAGCTSTSGYSPTTGQSCSGTTDTTDTTTGTTAITGEGLQVTVAANTPVTATVITGSELAPLVNLTFANGNNTEVKVTQLRMKRAGISADTSLGNIYLFDGYKRLSDEATFSSGYATFNKASGLFTIPAGTTKTIAVRAQVSGTSGETVNLSVEAATDVTSDASQITGTFPLTGNTMSIAAATSKATVNFNTVAIPAINANFTAAVNSVMWQDSFTATNQDVKLEYIKFSQIGSVPADALENIKLDMNGVTVATGQLVSSDVGQDLVFDLSAAPVTVTKGFTKTLTIYADVVKGSSKTIRMSIEKPADIFIKDAAYGNYVLVTVNSAAFTTMRAGTLTITTGSVTIIKRSDSVSTGVVLGANNVSLARYDIKATGEDVKINNLQIEIIDSTSSTYIRNVSLYLDGVQVGNTTNVETDNGATGYSTINIYQVFSAGVAKVLEIKGDIFGCASSACTGVNGLAAGNSLYAVVVGGSISNAQGMSSLSMIDAPAASVNGNNRAIGSGSLTGVKSTSYGNQTVAAGTDTKLGQYTLTASQYDNVNVSSMTIGLLDTGTALVADLSNLYIKYGSVTSEVRGAVAASNVFSAPVTIAPNSSLSVEVWATITTAAISGDAATTSLAVTATRATDGGSASVTVSNGQVITVNNGALAAVRASDSPVEALIVGSTNDQLLSKYTFAANYEPFTVTEVKIEATNTPAATADNYNGIYLKYKDAAGTTVTSAIMPLVNGTSSFTNQTFNVPANGSAALEVYGNMNAVGAGYADTGDRPQLGLYYYKATSGSTSSYEVTPTTAVAGKQMVLFASKPSVSLVGSTSGSLNNGTMSLYAASIAADAKGAVGLKKLTFNVSPGMGSGDTIGSFTLYRGATDITSLVSITEATGTSPTDLTSGNLASSTSATTVVVVFTAEEQIAAGSSQTYTLKATVTGVGTVGESITTYLKKDSSYVAPSAYDIGTFGATNFVWTDRSKLNHDETTADWNNSYLVQTLDSPSYTLSK